MNTRVATRTAYTDAATFAAVARALQAELARQSLRCPAFRAPPKADAPRTIRRCKDAVVVAVRLDRDVNLVASDLIDGALAANADLLEAEPEAAEIIRAALWDAAGEALGSA